MKAIVYSKLSPSDCLKKIEAVTHLGSPFFFKAFLSDKKFIGKFNDNKFSIRLISRYRNSFSATIKGLVVPHNDSGSKVLLRSTFSPLVFVIAGIFLLFGYSLASEPMMRSDTGLEWLFIAGVFLIFIISIVSYHYEAAKSIRIIADVIKLP